MSSEKIMLNLAISALQTTTREFRALTLGEKENEILENNDRIIAGYARASEPCENFFWFGGKVSQ